jgi:hypothetical protein
MFCEYMFSCYLFLFILLFSTSSMFELLASVVMFNILKLIVEIVANSPTSTFFSLLSLLANRLGSDFDSRFAAHDPVPVVVPSRVAVVVSPPSTVATAASSTTSTSTGTTSEARCAGMAMVAPGRHQRHRFVMLVGAGAGVAGSVVLHNDRFSEIQVRLHELSAFLPPDNPNSDPWER